MSNRKYDITINSIEPCVSEAIGFKSNSYYIPETNRKNDAFVNSQIQSSEWKTDWKSIYIVTLVAFIGSVHQNCFNVWPYLLLMDKSANETFYGMMRSTSGIGSALSSLFAGYLCNLLQNTKNPMIFSKIMAIISCILYLLIETLNKWQKFVFLTFELLLGISGGTANVYRVYIAHNSTENDRSKAVAICLFAPAFGLLVGTIIQLIVTKIKYPGISFIFGIHLNLYTAPMFLTIFISIIGLLLLIFCFNGKMHIENEHLLSKTIKTTNCDQYNVYKYDLFAAILCMATRSVVSSTTIIFMTIGSPYMMTVFKWTGEETVIYQSIILFIIGIHIIFWNLAYIFFDFQSRFSERRVIIFSLFILLACFLGTYPWSFISKTIEYAKPINNLLINTTTSLLAVSNNSAAYNQNFTLGCSPSFAWCSTTPAVNFYLFLSSIIITLGIGLPLININLDILFSKILGCNVKQGLMQGIYAGSSDGLNIILPIFISYVYMKTGPIYIWQCIMAVLCICLICWLVLYSRMIGKSKRLKCISDANKIFN